ncbi:hypothetical protein [Marivivens niveibacter]|uniref:hypothetical protein n=1 Tax=Marivivens niveibacter TaxID=1930667 RepID=UPI0013FD6ADD|nr:hypothetical protein [Marivivens niveibacter]
MAEIMERFWNDDKGSNAVDWLVLSAGLVMLSIAIFAVIDTSASNIAQDDAAVATIAGV